MIVVERSGNFLPSKLAGELRDAGVDVVGVTCTEDDDGNVVVVQILVDADSVDDAAIDAVTAAHDPTPIDAPATDAFDDRVADAAAAAVGAVLSVIAPDMTQKQRDEATVAARAAASDAAQQPE